jgi:hypothetical protein
VKEMIGCETAMEGICEEEPCSEVQEKELETNVGFCCLLHFSIMI